ncbi:hypothetical protein CN278_25805 [Bacillus thuringiensis]|nr:hypothetical protein CN278_25805 [Bacillus thuringiensis]
MLKMRNTLCNSNEVYLTSKHIETKKLRSYMQWSRGGKVETLFPKSFTKMYHRALSESHIRKCSIEDVIRMQQELFTLYQAAGLSTDTIVSLAEQEITKTDYHNARSYRHYKTGEIIPRKNIKFQ